MTNTKTRTVGQLIRSNDPSQTYGTVIAVEGRKVAVLFLGHARPTEFYGNEFENLCDKA